MVQKTSISFVQSILTAFKKINSEISIDTLEHDFSPRFVKYAVEGVLGYSGTEYAFERGRTDITLLDENNNRVVVIETKRPREDLNEEKWRNQAGKYADSSTRYVGLTNGYRFILWEVKNDERILRTDVDFKRLINSKKTREEKLSTREVEQILYLDNITKEQVWSESKYLKFDEYYAKIDVVEDNGFDKLIENLNYISDDILRQYTYSAFDEYYAGYAQYKQAKGEIDEIKKQATGNQRETADIARLELKTEGRYKKYAPFVGYYIWKAISNRQDSKEEENKQIFCKESIYVLLNRLLFIRICEDKGLLSKKISNGGIERLREQLYEPSMPDSGVFRQIVLFSYNAANNLYYHFYEKDNPLDWYESGDGELDRVINRVLWILNQFNFSKVDRDILGKLYEKYLPKEERKELGEFYTPDEVIDYILDAVGYAPSRSIEEKDLIDPACGSGGFLVRATRRLIARHAVKLGKATPKEALDSKKWQEVYERLTPKECEEIVNSVALHIHGFDINPFAVNITEMNLLFQIIDLYFKAIKSNKSFRVPRFKVYETDSLEVRNRQLNITQFYGSTGKNLAKDKEASDELKNKMYDFVVGNPPYVRQEEVRNKKQLEKDFPEVYHGRADLYVYFIELGIKLLNKNGKLGYITSNKFMKTGYGEGARRFILDHTKLEHILDFGDSKLFKDATNYPCIFIVSSSTASPTPVAAVSVTDKAIIKENELDEVLSLIRKQKSKLVGVNFIELSQENLSDQKWLILPTEELTIIEKIKERGTPLYPNYADDIIIGMRTGFNAAFIINSEEDYEENVTKPVVTGKDIEPFHIGNFKFCLYPNGQDPRMIPKTMNHLAKYKSELESRAQYKQRKDMRWFDIEQPVSQEKFSMPKIMTPAISEKNSFHFDESGLFCFDSCNMIFPKIKKKEFAYYLTGLLNSKLMFFFITSYSPYVQAKYFTYKPQYLKPLPIVSYSEDERKSKEISELTKKLQQLYKNSSNNGNREAATLLMKELDNLIYDLYKISDRERKIIENYSP